MGSAQSPARQRRPSTSTQVGSSGQAGSRSVGRLLGSEPPIALTAASARVHARRNSTRRRAGAARRQRSGKKRRSIRSASSSATGPSTSTPTGSWASATASSEPWWLTAISSGPGTWGLPAPSRRTSTRSGATPR